MTLALLALAGPLALWGVIDDRDEALAGAGLLAAFVMGRWAA